MLEPVEAEGGRVKTYKTLATTGVGGVLIPPSTLRIPDEYEGYIPVFRGVGRRGFKSIRPSSEGVLGEGVYFYSRPKDAAAYAGSGGIITAFVHPADAVIKGQVVVVRNADKIIRRGDIPSAMIPDEYGSGKLDEIASEALSWPYRPVASNTQGRHRYLVFIDKTYFPRATWPKLKVAQEDLEQWTILATSRASAARSAWRKYGARLLRLMGPRKTALPRKVSLHVSDPDTGTAAGRLVPILVYVGD